VRKVAQECEAVARVMTQMVFADSRHSECAISATSWPSSAAMLSPRTRRSVFVFVLFPNPTVASRCKLK
jgi:hypothetical protein